MLYFHLLPSVHSGLFKSTKSRSAHLNPVVQIFVFAYSINVSVMVQFIGNADDKRMRFSPREALWKRVSLKKKD